jgi:hypothetical protein
VQSWTTTMITTIHLRSLANTVLTPLRRISLCESTLYFTLAWEENRAQGYVRVQSRLLRKAISSRIMLHGHRNIVAAFWEHFSSFTTSHRNNPIVDDPQATYRVKYQRRTSGRIVATQLSTALMRRQTTHHRDLVLQLQTVVGLPHATGTPRSTGVLPTLRSHILSDHQLLSVPRVSLALANKYNNA